MNDLVQKTLESMAKSMKGASDSFKENGFRKYSDLNDIPKTYKYKEIPKEAIDLTAVTGYDERIGNQPDVKFMGMQLSYGLLAQLKRDYSFRLRSRIECMMAGVNRLNLAGIENGRLLRDVIERFKFYDELENKEEESAGGE